MELLDPTICNVIIVNFVVFSFSLIISVLLLLLQKSNTIIERELFKYSEHLAPHNKRAVRPSEKFHDPARREEHAAVRIKFTSTFSKYGVINLE